MAARLGLSDADCWAQAGASFMAGDDRPEGATQDLPGAFPAAAGAALAPLDVWYFEQTRSLRRRRSRRAVRDRGGR
jgi:hypothetical protein